jgi:hypothetical protein
LVLQVLGVVAAVLLLLWGADTLARISAQALLERNIQDATGLEVRPEVEVQGLLFLPQLIRGTYSEVHVTTRGITSGPLRIDRVDSQLFDVQVPFHDVLVGNIREVAIGRSVEDLDLTYEDLNAYFAATGRRLKLSPSGDGSVTPPETSTCWARAYEFRRRHLVGGRRSAEFRHRTSAQAPCHSTRLAGYCYGNDRR